MSFLCPLSARILQRQSNLQANNQILNHDSFRQTEKLQSIHHITAVTLTNKL